MITEETYIVITRYAMRDNKIGMAIFDSFEDAMAEATSELSAEYTTQVEIFEASKADRIFLERRVFNKAKR